MPRGGGGGLPQHVAAGANKNISKRERYILRVGSAPGKSGKAERKIIAMREAAENRRKRAAAAADPSTAAAENAAATSASSSMPAAPEDDSSLYRKYKAQEKAKEARAAAATNVATPAAVSFLDSLRADMRAGK